MKSIAMQVVLLVAGCSCLAQQNVPGIGFSESFSNRNLSIGGITSGELGIYSAPTVVSACDFSDGCFALPVELLEFKGKRENNTSVLLEWETVNEVNNHGFEVQRSFLSNQMFEKVTFVDAQHTESLRKFYSLRDANDFSGITYYRLKQIDLDGKFTFSKIISVKGYALNGTLVVQPNPVLSRMTLLADIPQAGAGELEIINYAGKLVLSKAVMLQKGSNPISVPVDALASGLYAARIRMQNGLVLIRQFVKQY